MNDEADHVRVQSETTISLPLRESERTLAVRHLEWKRVRRRVERLKDPSHQGGSGGALFFLGVSVTAGFSILALFAGSEQPRSWVVAIYATATVSSLLLAGTWHHFSKRSGRTRRDEVLEICTEMDDIEARFGNPPVDT
jgi:predicted membrane channel-forming protein YqfA (hemolysin III family)